MKAMGESIMSHISRRIFAKSAGAGLTLSAAAIAGCSESSKIKNHRLKLGLASYTLRKFNFDSFGLAK